MAYLVRSITHSSGQSSNGSSTKEISIADIPQAHRDKLCLYLDEKNVWIDLADLMQLSSNDIKFIERRKAFGESPTDHLLRIWGNVYNHTATELFMLFYQKKLYTAMRMLKSLVPYKYHVLISNSYPDLSQLLQPKVAIASKKTEKILNCSALTPSSLQTTDDNYTTTSVSSLDAPILSERSVKQYANSNLEINYEELKDATDCWNKDNILGKGGFGTVYKGYWKYTEVAIKQIHYSALNGCDNIKVQIQQSLNELKYLNSFRHDNVLPLYGYSIRGERPCLVYQFMRKGCLDKALHINHETPLSLTDRIKISVGIARGINYIHTHTPDKPLIHGDIKPANVLLDECLTPKIGDFGLAREGPNAIKMAVEVTQIFGTKCYLPPEFLQLKKLSTQVDTYSFGVTLLETFTGEKAYVPNREQPLLKKYVVSFWQNPEKDISKLLDPKMQCEKENYEKCFQILSLGLDCTAKNPHERPEMEDVLLKLSQYL